MIYIIDANNLAGKLCLLPVKEHGQKVVEIVKEFFENRQIRVFLVFDSLEYMGDKVSDGFLTVVYAPRDSFYSSADDKIVELVWQNVGVSPDFAEADKSEEFDMKDEIVMVSDDLEIISKIEEVQKKVGTNRLRIERSSDFAVRMNARERGRNLRKKNINQGERGLSKGEIDNINEELLEVWK